MKFIKNKGFGNYPTVLIPINDFFIDGKNENIKSRLNLNDGMYNLNKDIQQCFNTYKGRMSDLISGKIAKNKSLNFNMNDVIFLNSKFFVCKENGGVSIYALNNLDLIEEKNANTNNSNLPNNNIEKIYSISGKIFMKFQSYLVESDNNISNFTTYQRVGYLKYSQNYNIVGVHYINDKIVLVFDSFLSVYNPNINVWCSFLLYDNSGEVLNNVSISYYKDYNLYLYTSNNKLYKLNLQNSQIFNFQSNLNNYINGFKCLNGNNESERNKLLEWVGIEKESSDVRFFYDVYNEGVKINTIDLGSSTSCTVGFDANRTLKFYYKIGTEKSQEIICTYTYTNIDNVKTYRLTIDTNTKILVCENASNINLVKSYYNKNEDELLFINSDKYVLKLDNSKSIPNPFINTQIQIDNYSNVSFIQTIVFNNKYYILSKINNSILIHFDKEQDPAAADPFRNNFFNNLRYFGVRFNSAFLECAERAVNSLLLGSSNYNLLFFSRNINNKSVMFTRNEILYYEKFGGTANIYSIVLETNPPEGIPTFTVELKNTSDLVETIISMFRYNGNFFKINNKEPVYVIFHVINKYWFICGKEFRKDHEMQKAIKDMTD